MKYSRGNIGRVFVARMDSGDDLTGDLKRLAREERIGAAVLYVVGALKEASMVVGPERCSLPPDPVWRSFSDCREVLGIGTLFPDDSGEPVLHLHGAVGRGDAALAGCIRGEAGVYLVSEVIVLEIVGTGAVKIFEEQSGLKMLNFSGPEE